MKGCSRVTDWDASAVKWSLQPNLHSWLSPEDSVNCRLFFSASLLRNPEFCRRQHKSQPLRPYIKPIQSNSDYFRPLSGYPHIHANRCWDVSIRTFVRTSCVSCTCHVAVLCSRAADERYGFQRFSPYSFPPSLVSPPRFETSHKNLISVYFLSSCLSPRDMSVCAQRQHRGYNKTM